MEAIVRAQIDRLTPWSPAQAAFGCGAATTISGGSRRRDRRRDGAILDHAHRERVGADGPHSIVVPTALDTASERPPRRIVVFAQQTNRQRRVLRLRWGFIAAPVMVGRADHIKETTLVLAGGEVLSFQSVGEEEWTKKRGAAGTEGHIYREIFRILNTHRKAIREHFPRIPRHVSGYNLDRLLTAPPLNVSQLVAGSEGTLGIAAAIKVKIAKKPRFTGVCVVHFAGMIPAMRSIGAMMAHRPIALEMIDDKIINAARLSRPVQGRLGWLAGNPQAVFIAEFEGSSPT